MMSAGIVWIILGIILGAIFALVGLLLAKRRYEETMRLAKEEVERLKEKHITEARKEADRIISSAKRKIEEEQRKLHSEISRKKHEISRQRNQLREEEERLRRKEENLRRLERELRQKEGELLKRENRVKNAENELLAKLEEISRMTTDEAKQELMRRVERLARLEAAQLSIKIKDEARQRAEEEAREIIATAIQRCAASRTAEVTTTIVELPSEEIKGRIIGREGRNIRAFEAITGVELIVDDTPEIVVISSFDALRREKARVILERLIEDGRIHPARIEEVARKVEEEFDEHIRKIGEETLVDLEISYMHPELVKLVGKMKFRTSYGQNLLAHSVETAKLAGIMAAELGLNVEDARRAGLLHDIGKVVEEEEGPHALVGAMVAKRYGEKEAVVNAIASHHGDVEPMTLIAPLVAAADAISGARPGARRESIEQYIKRLQDLERIAYRFPGVQKVYALYAGREIRVIVDADKVSDLEARALSEEIARAIENELQYPGQIRVIVIREIRAVSVAR
ncbi:MAG: ribonuclease Y [Thermotogae bacterium]|nr:ribonuclease Y [Thermotogota bacterium]